MQDSRSIDSEHYDVAIIGAGVAGSMVALLCSRAGLRTVLLERHRFPRHKICGCCVNGRAFQMLRRAGLESGLRQLQPATTSSLAVRYRGRKLNVSMPTGFAVSRRMMDQWLVDEAIASGCQFVDEVTASVQPLASESDEVPVANFDSCKPGHPEERIIQLRFANCHSPHGATPADDDFSASRDLQVCARIVLVCDGLGHPSLHLLPSFKAEPAAGSRIGLGAVFPRMAADAWIRQGEVLMAVASQGYAGVVQIEDNQFNLAAAIDPSCLSKSNSPLDCLANLFHSARVPMPQELRNAAIKGTVPLTRSARRIAGHRLFLLGDATGYVEPFTGEGMAWALTAATIAIPFVVSAIRNGWSYELINRWQASSSETTRTQQKVCRLLSATLKHPWLLPPVMTTCQFFPTLTQRVVNRINRVPKALEIV